VRSADRSGKTYHVVKADSGDPIDEPREGTVLAQREIRACQVCGTKFSATSHIECCPVCLLRGAAGGEGKAIGASDPVSEAEPGPTDPRPRKVATRFENYELAIGEDGKPIELGRGAMGITYKAFDVDLRYPVTLKVISERYLDDESARLRFLREARAAASLRHPNVASVFHLGRSGGNYFYAMEFVEGETVGHLIKRCGRLEVKLALEITNQVAAGLAAVQRKNLVHRDIKPTNIMVSFEVGTGVTVKIIDLGLAKAVEEPHPEAGISTPGAFAGTPHFASPEQCSGRQTDIRSDLYSLGLTLWQMMTGKLPFDGTSLEVMSQHLLAPLPIEHLKHVPQPVVALVKCLLDKDPARRPQSPSDLQIMLREAQAALDTKVNLRSKDVPRRALKQRRGEAPHQHRLGRLSGLKEALRAETRGLLPEPWDFTPLLVEKLKGFTGREWVFQVIDKWRLKCSPPALLIVGEPGVGKSTVLAQLIQRNPGGYILAYHCCRTDTPATLDPAGFVRNLAAMISARFDEYAAMLEGPAIVDALARSDNDPASAFDAAILSPLHKIRVPEGARRYLVIDALDESLVRMQRPRIFDVLSTRFDRLPLWLGVVASMRDNPGLLSQLGSMSIYVLDAKDQRNQEDIRRFIQSRLAEPLLHDQAKTAGRITARVENDLLKSSAGNFLFVTTALNAVESGQLGFDQIEKLPAGLRSLYELFFHRLFPDFDADFRPFRRVLETVAAAREPLTREQIASVTGLDAEEELPRSLSRLASFLPVCDGRYTFFHKSLFDWLTGWETRDDRPIAGPYYISLKKGRKRLADRCWDEYERGLSVASLYALRHLPGHLHEVGREHDARSVLLNFDFLQAKLQATGVNELIADYEFLPEDTDLRLVQSAIRLSAHVLARDHCQLAGQLTGRLLGDRAPNIQALLQQALQKTPWPWLRPLKPTLAPPGGPLIRTFQGHTDWVHAVVLTPDGRYAISGSRDHTLQVWDLETGQSVRTLEGHTDLVNAAAVTPNGNYAISGSADRTLRVWDLESGQLVRTLQGHTDRVNAVAVTPDGSRAVSASADRTLRVWDLESGQLVRTLEGHLDMVNAVAVTPVGHAAVSASSDHTLRVWDLESGQLVRTLEGHPDWVHAVVVTPDRRRAISGSADNTLRVWDLESGQLVRTLAGHTNRVTAVVLTPDGRRAISGSADHTLRMWDLESGQLVRTLTGHTDWVTAVVVTPDGRRAVSASADHTLRIWDLERGESVNKLAGHTDNVTAVALMPDGRRAALVSDYHLLRVWDLESGELLRALEGHTDWVTAVAVTPDGRRAVSASADHTLRAWDLESGRSVRTLTGHAELVSAVAVTPDGHRAISASADHTLRVWDLESGHAVHTLEGLVNLVSAVTVTPDGRCALWGSDVGALLVWDLESGETMRVLEGHTHWVTAVAITPDGRRAVSASSGGTLRLWDLERDQSLCTLQDHAAQVHALTVTPDGKYAISASSDHTVRVWDVERGISITAFTGESPMLRCAIAPDGRTIIAREKSGRGHFLRLEGLQP
jgi:WD40 repeat protein/serine/threonine protein kinase